MKLRDFLELARVSNLPTVWSNAWMGLMAGFVVLTHTLDANHPSVSSLLKHGVIHFFPQILLQVAWITLSMSFLYIGGMILNDYLDRRIDAHERPSRPIPSGRVTPTQAFGLAVSCFILGLIGVVSFERSYLWFDYQPWRASAFAGVLVVTIVVYNINHQRSKLSVILMGVCRGLVVLTCATTKIPPVQHSIWWLFVASPAAILVAYTILISIVARREVDPKRRGFGGPKAVMNMIAAMPLLDAIWLVVMGLWPASLVCVGCAVLTKLGHRRIAGS